MDRSLLKAGCSECNLEESRPPVGEFRRHMELHVDCSPFWTNIRMMSGQPEALLQILVQGWANFLTGGGHNGF